MLTLWLLILPVSKQAHKGVIMAVVGINTIVHFGKGSEVVKTEYGYHVYSKDYPLRKGHEYDFAISTHGVITIGAKPAQDLTLEYAEITNMTRVIETGLEEILKGINDETHRNRYKRESIWGSHIYSR